MLSNKDISQIAEMDRLNMADMMMAMGNVYTIEKRKADVLAEMGKGVKFICVRRNNKVIAYISYKILGEELLVKSIQISPTASRFILKALLLETLSALRDETYTSIRSKVFANNIPSRNFHLKLGFALREEKDSICYFYTAKEKLMQKLEHYQ